MQRPRPKFRCFLAVLPGILLLSLAVLFLPSTTNNNSLRRSLQDGPPFNPPFRGPPSGPAVVLGTAINGLSELRAKNHKDHEQEDSVNCTIFDRGPPFPCRNGEGPSSQNPTEAVGPLLPFPNRMKFGVYVGLKPHSHHIANLMTGVVILGLNRSMPETSFVVNSVYTIDFEGDTFEDIPRGVNGTNEGIDALNPNGEMDSAGGTGMPNQMGGAGGTGMMEEPGLNMPNSNGGVDGAGGTGMGRPGGADMPDPDEEMNGTGGSTEMGRPGGANMPNPNGQMNATGLGAAGMTRPNPSMEAAGEGSTEPMTTQVENGGNRQLARLLQMGVMFGPRRGGRRRIAMYHRRTGADLVEETGGRQWWYHEIVFDCFWEDVNRPIGRAILMSLELNMTRTIQRIGPMLETRLQDLLDDPTIRIRDEETWSESDGPGDEPPSVAPTPSAISTFGSTMPTLSTTIGPISPPEIIADPEPGKFTQPIKLGKCSWQQYVGIIILCTTVSTSLVLSQYGAYRKRNRIRKHVWGNLASEEGVKELLNTGWIVKGSNLQIFDKTNFGYEEESSMLMGGYEQKEVLGAEITVTMQESETTPESTET